jgi:DNA-binding transcriptional ArsR family regulator
MKATEATGNEALAARVARLERLVGVSGAEPAPPSAGEGAPHGRMGLGDWLTARRKPGRAAVGIVAGTDHASASASSTFRQDAPPADLQRVADLCQALASAARLALLRELFRGPRGRAELLAAAGIDRGQLYHHLRDLFVHGLVEQPERGRYALTGRGTVVFLAATLLPQLGGPGQPGQMPPPEDLDRDEVAGTEATGSGPTR